MLARHDQHDLVLEEFFEPDSRAPGWSLDHRQLDSSVAQHLYDFLRIPAQHRNLDARMCAREMRKNMRQHVLRYRCRDAERQSTSNILRCLADAAPRLFVELFDPPRIVEQNLARRRQTHLAAHAVE